MTLSTFRMNTYEKHTGWGRGAGLSLFCMALLPNLKSLFFATGARNVPTSKCAFCIPDASSGRSNRRYSAIVGRRSRPGRDVQTSRRSISSLFFMLQTYLHNGRCPTLLESVHYAHVSSPRRVCVSPCHLCARCVLCDLCVKSFFSFRPSIEDPGPAGTVDCQPPPCRSSQVHICYSGTSK
jgi:hypothetical protein